MSRNLQASQRSPRLGQLPFALNHLWWVSHTLSALPDAQKLPELTVTTWTLPLPRCLLLGTSMELLLEGPGRLHWVAVRPTIQTLTLAETSRVYPYGMAAGGTHRGGSCGVGGNLLPGGGVRDGLLGLGGSSPLNIPAGLVGDSSDPALVVHPGRHSWDGLDIPIGLVGGSSWTPGVGTSHPDRPSYPPPAAASSPTNAGASAVARGPFQAPRFCLLVEFKK